MLLSAARMANATARRGATCVNIDLREVLSKREHLGRLQTAQIFRLLENMAVLELLNSWNFREVKRHLWAELQLAARPSLGCYKRGTSEVSLL